MAIVSVNKLFSGRGGAVDFLGRRTYRETWEVLTDSVLDNELTVTAAAGVPRRFQRHPIDPLAICTDIAPEQSDDTPYLWHVDIKYDSKPDWPAATDPQGDQPTDIPDNPLLRPPVWKIGGRNTSEACTLWLPVDTLGNIGANLVMPTNSAQLPFDPPLMVEVSRPVLRVTTNVAQVTLEYLLSLQDAINDRPWRTLPKWTARVDSYDASNKNENGVAFVELTLDIALKGETWITRLLDSGLLELTMRTDPATGRQKQVWTKIRDSFGHESDSPQPLDGNGRRLQPGAQPVFRFGLPSNYHLANYDTLMPF